MKTRSRAASQIVANESVEVRVEGKKKATKKQSNDAVVASIISAIKEENTAKISIEADSSSDLNAAKNPSRSGAAPKVVRGQPKSGRPWKEVKQR